MPPTHRTLRQVTEVKKQFGVQDLVESLTPSTQRRAIQHPCDTHEPMSTLSGLALNPSNGPSSWGARRPDADRGNY